MEAGILEADGDGFVTRAPGLVRAGADLVANGLPGDAVMDIGVAIWNAADDLARRMVDAFVDGVWRPFEEAGMPQDEWPRILGILDRSRDAVLAGVMSAFGGAIRQAIEAALERLGQPLELAGTQTQKELSASDDA